MVALMNHRVTRRIVMLPKGMIVGLVVALLGCIAGYVTLELEHDDGAILLAVAISPIISIFVAVQNAWMARVLDRVKNQTNGMTHHVMEENKRLREAKTLVDPAQITHISGEEKRRRRHVDGQ